MIIKAILLVLWAFRDVSGDLVDTFNMTGPGECEKHEFFNVATLKCEKCDPTRLLVSSDDKLSCTCNEKSVIRARDQKGQIWCAACPKGKYPSLEKRACISCANSSLSPETGRCECTSDSILVERAANGSQILESFCVKCATGTKPSPDRTRCVPCLIPGKNCTCTTRFGVTMPNNECVETLQFATFGFNQESFEIDYGNDKVESPFLKDYLQYAAYGCKLLIPERCEFLANLCVLTMYQDTVPGGPCKILKDLKKSTHQHNAIPWIYYPEGEASSILSKRKVKTKYTMMAEADTSYVQIVLSKWSFNGTWLGYTDGFKEFQLCPTTEPLKRIR